MVSLSDVCKLYVATFNRAPDAAGLEYWAYHSGLTLEEIAQSFFDQPETQALYPQGTPAASFVNSVYNNLFNRDAETAGLEYWVGELDSGRVSKQNFILAVINGALDTDISHDATILSHKQAVGMEFVQMNLNDVGLAQLIMQHIDASVSSVNDASIIIQNVSAPTGTLSVDMISGTTVYHYNDDFDSYDLQEGQDYCTAITFNADGTITNTEYSAPFGGSTWTLSADDNPQTMHWSIENGRLIVTDDSDDWNGSDTLTLIRETQEESLFYDSWYGINSNGTPDPSDDIAESGNEIITLFMSMPLPRTEEQIRQELGLENDDTTGTDCDLSDGPLTLEQMTKLAQLVWYNDENGILSTASIREAVISETGADAYYAAFEAQMGDNGCDEIASATMLGREDLALLPDTVETAENLMYGTEIHILKNLDMNEALSLENFITANSSALETYNAAIWDQYVDLIVDIFSDMETAPAIQQSGLYLYPGYSLDQIVRVMVVESTIDFVGMATQDNYIPNGMFDDFMI